jgi:hypothetical protein
MKLESEQAEKLSPQTRSEACRVLGLTRKKTLIDADPERKDIARKR